MAALAAGASVAAGQAAGQTVDLGTIPVVAPALNADGSTTASGGMVVPTPDVGPFGPEDARDEPFSINSIPSTLLTDQQVHDASNALKNDPSVRAFPSTNAFAQNYLIRGFEVGPEYGIYQDGLDLLGYTDAAVESDQRIDILKGATSVFYGFAAPAGVVSYQSKMPLDAPLTEVSLGYISRATADEQLDLSRRFGPGDQFGARLNLYQQDGDTAVDSSSTDRDLQELALDWKPLWAPGLRVWTILHHDDERDRGGNSVFFFNGPVSGIPNPPDPFRLYGQPWNYQDFDTARVEGGLDYDHDGWVAHAAIGYSSATERYDGNYNGVGLTNDGVYGVAANRGKFADLSTAYRVTVGKSFAIGPVTQTINLVADGSDHLFHDSVPLTGPLMLGLSSLSDPITYPEPTITTIPAVLRENLRFNSQIASDTITLGPASLFAGFVHSGINDAASEDAGIAGPAPFVYQLIRQDKFTPLAALTFRLTKAISLYASYIQALEPGQQAPETAINSLAFLPPFTGEQYEAGIKAAVTPGLELDAALFRIEQAYAYLNTSNVFVEDGTERHDGVEFTARGRVLPGLSVFGGVTLIDPELSDALPTGQVSSEVRGVARVRANIYAEYDVPGVRGLALLGGAYVSDRTPAVLNAPADVANGYPSVVSVPAYATLDLGARYTTEVNRTPVTLRAYVTNVTNTHYWTNYGNPVALGLPTTAKLSLTADF